MRWTVGALTGAAVLVLAAGCNTAADGPDAGGPTPGANGQPGAAQGGQPGGAAGSSSPVNVNVAEALKTAEKEFGLLAKGDWAGAWALWTDAAKREVPQAVFVEANTACPAALKRQYQLQNVHPVSGSLVELTFRRGDDVEHGALRTAASGWLFEPGGGMLVEYANGAKATIDKRKADSRC
jgi:hypothetical protein